MKLNDSCKIYFGAVSAKEIWLGSKLVWNPCPYIFDIEVTNIYQIQGIDQFCPRVNAWAEGADFTQYTYLTAVTSYTEVFDYSLQGVAGVDIFYWTEFQQATYTYDGNPIITTQAAGDNLDQTKVSLSYNSPSLTGYNISVSITPKPSPAPVGGGSFNHITSNICLSGSSESSVNGTYTYLTSSGIGRGIWTMSTMSETLSVFYDSSTKLWRIDSDSNYYYYSYSNASYPWLVTSWNFQPNITLPAPTITEGSCV